MHPSPHLMRTNLSSLNNIEKCMDAEMNDATSQSFAKLSLLECQGNGPTEPESNCCPRKEAYTRTSLDALQFEGCTTLPSGDDQLIIRRSFLRGIETMLSESGEHDGYKIIQLAQSLEQLLFKTAPSFREYANSKTLKDRLRLLTVSLLRRRLKKRQIPSREEALRVTLGTERFREVGQLTHEVKQLRLKRISWSCHHCNDNELCTLPSEKPVPFKAQERLPLPVRSLFFETALVQAFDSAPVNRIPLLEWDAMMDEARNNIRRFNDWCEQANALSRC